MAIGMGEEFQYSAWLERVGDDAVTIRGTCSIGRAKSNHVVLADEKVSRRHAFIHAQGEDEFWLVDLGSSNGTYLNRRRVAQSVQLRDRDQIEIGSFQLVFRQAQPPRVAASGLVDVDKTVHEIKSSDCWLVVTDIASFTQLIRRLSPDELPVVTGRWFSNCKQVIDECGGAIDKYLGDGFLAYWHDGDAVPGEVARALKELKKIRESHPLPFRIVAHFGRVFTGGATASGVERLFGPDVNFVFRMERLASGLGQPCLLSEAAYQRAKTHLPGVEAGRHALQGFEGEHVFFSF
jgi:adenylate cyclase